MATEFTGRPVVSGDDGYIQVKDSVFNNNADFLGFGQVATYITSLWIRVPNVTIPQGSTITVAKLTFKSYDSRAGADVLLNIYMNDHDDAVAPTNYAEYNALALTDAFTVWDNVEAWVQNIIYDSLDFKSAVQEVVDRGSWASGNAMMVLIKDDGSTNNAFRLPDAQDLLEGTAPLLTIEYTAGAGTIVKDVIAPGIIPFAR